MCVKELELGEFVYRMVQWEPEGGQGGLSTMLMRAPIETHDDGDVENGPSPYQVYGNWEVLGEWFGMPLTIEQAIGEFHECDLCGATLGDVQKVSTGPFNIEAELCAHCRMDEKSYPFEEHV